MHDANLSDGRSIGSSNGSATNYPILQLVRIDNEQTFFPLSDPATDWSDIEFSSETLGSTTTLPAGPYRATIFTNAIPSLQKVVNLTGRPTTDVPGLPRDNGVALLLQNRPNPFRSSTVIQFSLGTPEQVSLEVFDLAAGRWGL